MIAVKLNFSLKCPHHPRYKGLQSPRAGCRACITIWKVLTQLGAWEGAIRATSYDGVEVHDVEAAKKRRKEEKRESQ